MGMKMFRGVEEEVHDIVSGRHVNADGLLNAGRVKPSRDILFPRSVDHADNGDSLAVLETEKAQATNS